MKSFDKLHLCFLAAALACSCAFVQGAGAADGDANAWRKSIDAGKLAYEQKKLDQAASHFKQAVAIAERIGSGDTRLAASLDHLATVYSVQKRYKDAEPLFDQALVILEKKYDKFHPTLVQTLQNLGMLYRANGDLEKAQKAYERILKIIEAEYGLDSEETATGIHNLAAVLGARGKFDEAAVQLKKVLAMREKLLGKEHDSIAATCKELGNTYFRLSKFPQAAQYYKRNLEIVEKKQAMSPGHLDALSKLATLHEVTKQYDEAISLHQQAIEIVKAKRGAKHSMVATISYRLAGDFAATSKFAQAKTNYEQALEIQIATLGQKHVDVAKTLFSLGRLLVTQRKFGEAEPYCKRAISTFAGTVGAKHPFYAISVLNYAVVLENTGRAEQAKKLKLLVEQLQKQVKSSSKTNSNSKVTPK